MTTYTPVIGATITPASWNSYQSKWIYPTTAPVYLSNLFNSSTGGENAIPTSVGTSDTFGLYSGSVSNGVIGFLTGSTPVAATYRPTTFSNSGCTFLSGSGPEAYDTNSSTYCEVHPASNINSSGTLTYYGMSGTYTGTLTVIYRLVSANVTIGANNAEVDANIQYSLNGGSTWTSFGYASGASGVIDTGVQTYTLAVTSQNLANLQIQVETYSQKAVLAIASSVGYVYDINVYGY